MKDIRKYLLEVPTTVKRSDTINFAMAELTHVMTLCGLPFIGRNSDVMGMINTEGVPVISLGETDIKKKYGLVADANNGGGYNITTVDENVFIYANSDEGVINGVYRFCEETFGYRFYAMDEERVDIKDEYPVPELNLSVKPDFAGRDLDFYGLYRDPIYCARLGLNASGQACRNAYTFGSCTPWSVLNDQSLAFQLIPREQYKTEEYVKKGWWSEKGDQLCWT